MSDAPQGPGWWQASDGKWYSPEQASGAQQPAATPGGGPYGQPVGGATTDASASAAFSYGWNKFTATPGPLVIAALIGFVVYGVLFLISYFGLLAGFVFSASSIECSTNSAGFWRLMSIASPSLASNGSSVSPANTCANRGGSPTANGSSW